MLISLRPCSVRWLMSLALMACACGSDAKKTEAAPDENEGGAATAAPSYPPALDPQDCATATSEIALSQPDGAAVWGGLVLLEFEVEGAKVESFDVQVFDPLLDAWTSNYVSRAVTGQRGDGTYFLAVSPYFSEASKDEGLMLRVRPTQDGCPAADWTETIAFTAGDPLAGGHWTGAVSAADFTGEIAIQRAPVNLGDATSTSSLRFGDATLSLDFGKKGVLTEVVTLSLLAKEGEPYEDCTLSLTFSGTYDVSPRAQYGGVRLSVSEQTLSGFKGTTCAFPKTADVAFSAADFNLRLNAYTQQGIAIDYLPTLFVEPGAPEWSSSNFAQIFTQLPQFLSYVTATEAGNVSGYVNSQELWLVRD